MSSIIEGYTYDIFISYRQKDNKHDGWVTEFVDQLKGELEATFKEDISVYFDINPHDGLLETHDVDASLKSKLKCLVFIPIISRTYCDPKSFAWEHEFRAFVEQASQDQFGLKVTLPNGNVANRILPIRIHELDAEDKSLLENELGGILRAVDFIYREPGVNRPLTPDDDEKINLNKTKYRNQINKVANAIQEIISGLRSGAGTPVKEKAHSGERLAGVGDVKRGEERKEREGREHKPGSVSRRRRLSWVIPLGILAVVAAILAYPKIFKRDTLKNLRSAGKISIVVMPFQNMTTETVWDTWQYGIQDNMITFLSNSPEELIVEPRENINNLLQAKGFTNNNSITSPVYSTISKSLDADVFVSGYIHKMGSTIRIVAQLIDSKTQKANQAFSIEDDAGQVKDFRFIDSLSLMVRDYLIISVLEKKVPPSSQNLAATNNPKAFQYLSDGDKAFFSGDFKLAAKSYSLAVQQDSAFIYARLMLSMAYCNQDSFELAKKWCMSTYVLRDQIPDLQRLHTEYMHALLFETPEEEIKYIRQMLDKEPRLVGFIGTLGLKYNLINQYKNAIPEFVRALEFYKKIGTKPMWVYSYIWLGIAYHNTGQFKKEKRLYKKAEQDFQDKPDLISRQAILAISQGNVTEGNRYIEEYRSICKDNSGTKSRLTKSLGYIYSEAGIPDKAEEYFRQAKLLQPDNPSMLYDLAYCLIDKDRNIDEGLELVDQALKIFPDNYTYLDCKGWGLFKQGKYQEAYEILLKSWKLRTDKAIYDHTAYLHLEEAKKAAANQNLK